MREVLEAVSRASRRSSAVVHEQMRVNVNSLATIACLAPWVGMFVTVLSIPSAFPGFSGQRESVMAYIFDHLATSMWFAAFGLAVGLMALWFYRYLSTRLDAIDFEMENASLDLLNRLSRFPGRFAVARTADGPMFGEKCPDELMREDKFRRRGMFLAGSALVLAWLAEIMRSGDLLPWVHLPLILLVSCLAAYPIWAKFLRRRPGGLIALSSIICLSWSVAELALGRLLP